MTVDDLATTYSAFQTADKSVFQRRARTLQSMWRQERGYDCGTHKARPLGSLLEKTWAEETLSNFLTDRIKDVVRSDVLDRDKSRGKFINKPRLLSNLLSSQPLCFNLFGELRFNRALASALVAHFTQGRFTDVTGIEFEYSPSRSDERYSSDRSAFDVYFECETSTGGRGFVGIEVKYHENIGDKSAKHRSRYDEVAKQMGCFRSGTIEALKVRPLQQFWRDHLLAGAIKLKDGFDDALFVVLYPRDNKACDAATTSYRELLEDSSSFDSWLIEDVLNFLSVNTKDAWPAVVYDRYCDFGKIDRRLSEG